VTQQAVRLPPQQPVGVVVEPRPPAVPQLQRRAAGSQLWPLSPVRVWRRSV